MNPKNAILKDEMLCKDSGISSGYNGDIIRCIKFQFSHMWIYSSI